jgi:hypothetical protein
MGKGTDRLRLVPREESAKIVCIRAAASAGRSTAADNMADASSAAAE